MSKFTLFTEVGFSNPDLNPAGYALFIDSDVEIDGSVRLTAASRYPWGELRPDVFNLNANVADLVVISE